MEWWETPDAQYESYLAEGVAKKAIGAYAGYRVAKWLAPKVIKGGIDAYHKGRDFASQTAQRAQDPQSHNRPDDYRYPDQAEPKPNDRQVAKEDAWDGYTIDEFGMPVVIENSVTKRIKKNAASYKAGFDQGQSQGLRTGRIQGVAGTVAAGAAAYGAYKGVKKLKSIWNDRKKAEAGAGAPAEEPKLPPAKPGHVKGSAHGPGGHVDYEADGYTRKF